MTTASTTLLGLALPVTGELSGTWGDVVNASLTNLLDTAIAGTTTLSSDADVTLSTTTLSANQARQAVILWTAGGTVTRTITAPAQSKSYVIINATSSSQSIKLVGVGPTTGITIVAGEKCFAAWNGTDFVKVGNTSGAGVFSTVTASSLTSGRVTYAGTAGLLQDSAALTYDGTAVTINKNSSALPASPVAAGGMLLQLGNADAAQSAIVSDSFGSSTTVNFRRANGTNASKTAVTTGALAQIRAYGYGSTAYSGIRAQISFNAAETWTDTAQGSAVTISTTPIGSATTAAIVGTFTGTGLDVTGTLSSTLDATIYGVTVGRGGGAVSTNTAVGFNAFALNTTGSQAVAVGYAALQKNTTGVYNTAVGYTALFSNLTGGYSVALGNGALYSNDSGTQNTSVGFGSTQTNTSGSNNTALGYLALQGNTTASDNTAVGYRAGYTNTTGAQNTAIGRDALNSNTTASGSTAVGYQAGYTNTGIVTAFGYRAGYSQTTNSTFQNSFFGYEAGFFATGAGHTAVGQNALRAMTTANWSTAVGYGALAADTGGTNTAVGANAAISTTGAGNSVVGWQALNTNISGTDNVAVGSNALFTTTAGSQVAVGSRAAYARTTATGETYASTFIGTQAGSGTTSGIELTFIGGFAGRYHTGNYNTAVGTAALYGASGTSTGTSNTALGYVSLFSNTSGSTNVALGGAALYSNLTASNNTAVGYQAGYTNTGTENTFLAKGAGYSLTTGNYNLFVGYHAGYFSTTGSYNTYVGHATGPVTTTSTGSYNTALGQSALAATTTASNITAVGYQAGYAVTASNNTFIGYKAGYLATTGGDNTIIGVSTPSGLTTGSNNVGLGGLSTYYTFNLTTESNRLIVGHSLISNAYVQVAWTVVSDARDKTDVATTSYGLDFVNELKPIQYRWDKRSHYDNGQPDGSKKEDKLQLGFLAQDVIALEKKYGATEKDLLIADDEQDDSLKITETKMIPVLVKAIQEQQAIITALTTRITALENK